MFILQIHLKGFNVLGIYLFLQSNTIFFVHSCKVILEDHIYMQKNIQKIGHNVLIYIIVDNILLIKR